MQGTPGRPDAGGSRTTHTTEPGIPVMIDDENAPPLGRAEDFPDRPDIPLCRIDVDDPEGGEVGGELFRQRRDLGLDAGLIPNPNPRRKGFGLIGATDDFQPKLRPDCRGGPDAIADDQDFIALEAGRIGRSCDDLINEVFESDAIGNVDAELGHQIFIRMTGFN